MKNRPRPHIPLSVRVQVAHRQLVEAGIWGPAHLALMQNSPTPAAQLLAHALRLLFGEEQPHLDHDPPLRWRAYSPRIKNVAARYTPNANDPAHLLYRSKQDHHIKTNVRGDGAQFPDRILIKRERRREKPKKKRKHQWPKGRKLQSRNTLRKRI